MSQNNDSQIIERPFGAMVARGPPKTEVEGSSPLRVAKRFCVFVN